MAAKRSWSDSFGRVFLEWEREENAARMRNAADLHMISSAAVDWGTYRSLKQYCACWMETTLGLYHLNNQRLVGRAPIKWGQVMYCILGMKEFSKLPAPIWDLIVGFLGYTCAFDGLLHLHLSRGKLNQARWGTRWLEAYLPVRLGAARPGRCKNRGCANMGCGAHSLQNGECVMCCVAKIRQLQGSHWEHHGMMLTLSFSNWLPEFLLPERYK